jgi:TonB-dependent starch-binding outer membrane protein SusC
MINFYMYSKKALLLLMAMALFTHSYAQDVTVSGRVIDQEGPVPGVNILIKGTTRGTVSDIEGNYSLSAPSDGTLVFSAIGYTIEEIAIGGRTNIDLTLVQDVRALAEVVVTGYTTEARRDVTGAVSTIKARELVAVPSGNVEQQLQGRVAGVTVITNGQPGTTSVVRIRGFGAFGGNQPLYIVDGVPTENADFLQPDDIESTTVLKDAASASIYGARAANGVIVMTTKKGIRNDRMRVSYDGVVGVTTPGTVNRILSPQEEADWTWQATRNTAWQLGTQPTFSHQQYGSGPNPVLPDYINVGGNPGVMGPIDLEAERQRYNIDPRQGAIYQVVRANKEGTNWWDEITRPALMSRHMLGFSGGTENSRYYTSLGVQDQQGIMIHQDFKRYSLRINSEHSLFNNRLRIGENFQGTYMQRRGLVGGSGGIGASQDENDFLQAFRMPAIIPVYDEFGGYAGTAARAFNNPRNPVANRDRGQDNRSRNIMGFGNLYAELDVIEGLTLRSSIGGGYFNNYNFFYNPPQYENSENNSSYTYGEGATFGFTWTFTNTARYQRTFGMHSFDLLAGMEALNNGQFRNIQGSGLNPFSFDPNYINLSVTQPGASRVVNSNFNYGVNFYSTFGSARYILNDKYIITGVLRRDGSSRFGENYRFGVFPAISAAWRISSEDFMAGVPFVTELKLRGGWGEMGNSNNVNPFNQFSLFASSVQLSAYDINGANNAVAEGFRRSRIGNPNARWETSATTNIGLDATFLNGRVDFIVDFWRKDTRDLLYQLEVAGVVAPLAASPEINIASMRNQGIDLELATRGNVAGGLGYEIRATGSFLKNEIRSLAPGVDFFDRSVGRLQAPVIRNQVGRPISSFFGYQVVGLFQDQADVDAHADQPGKGVGRFKFADVDGNGVVNAEDRVYLGDPIPDFSGGANLRLTFRNFELETFLGVFLGFENYHLNKWFTDFYPSFTGAAKGQNVKDSFIPVELGGSGGNTVPIYENVSNFSTNTQSHSYYVEKGNYARLMNLQIGYNLPETTLTRFGISRARVYVQSTNLFTISPYTGIDPGVGGNADVNLGIDVGNPPMTRGFNVGLNLGF